MAIAGFVKRVRDIMRMDAGISGDAQRIEQLVWILFLKVYDAKEEIWEFDDDDYESIIPEECRWRTWAKDNSLTGEKLLDFVNNTLFPVLKGKDVKIGDKLIHGIRINADTPPKKSIVQASFEDANNYMKDGVFLRQIVALVDEIDFEDTKESNAFGEIYETILKELQAAGSAGEFYTPRAVTEFMAKMIKPQLGEQMADFACGTGGFLTSWLKELRTQVQTTNDAKAVDASIYAVEKKPFPYLLCITNMLLHDMENPKVKHGNSLLYNVLDYTDDDKFDVILMNPPYGGKEDASVKGYFPDDLASSETADLFMSVIMYRLKQAGRAAVILPDGFLFGNDNAKSSIKKKMLKEFNLHTIVRMPGSVFAPYTSITTNILFFDNTEPTNSTWVYRLDMPDGYKHFSKTKPMRLEHFQPVMDWWNNRVEIMEGEWPKAKAYSAEEIAASGYNLDLCGYPHEEEEILPVDELIESYQVKRTALNQKIDSVLANIEALLEEKSMTPHKLRNSILQLAIEGKLTEQKAEDGNAADLLKEIQAEKAQLVKEKKIKKEKPLPEITEEEIPFEIPANWSWVRLGNIALVQSSKRVFEKDYVLEGVPFFRAKEIGDLHRGEIIKTELYITEEHYNTLAENYGVPKLGDILITSVGTIGNTWICDDRKFYYKDGNITQVCSNKYFDSRYVDYFLHSALFEQQALLTVSGTAYSALTIIKLKKVIIPLPPLAEQKRIVARLEAILPHVDEYEKAYNELQELNAKFPAKLKNSLLQMAIEGKLTEQKAEDGNAADLFKEIQAEKAQLIKDKKIKKEKPLPVITEEEIPFEIPENWCWVRLRDIAFNRGQKKPNSKFTYIDIGSIDNERQVLGFDENVIEAEKAPSRARKIVEYGDILYSTVRPYLHNMCIIDKNFEIEPIASTGFAVLTCHTGVNNKFLFYYLLAPEFDIYANSNDNAKGVAYPAINDDKLYRAVIPLPPLAEQKRIVTKLEQLLAQSDQLTN